MVSRVSQREALEEHLRRIAAGAQNPWLLQMNVEEWFQILLRVAEYNRKHTDNPIRPVVP